MDKDSGKQKDLNENEELKNIIKVEKKIKELTVELYKLNELYGKLRANYNPPIIYYTNSEKS